MGKSESAASRAWLRALELTARIDAAPERIFPLVIAEGARRFNASPALLSPRENLSHADLASRADGWACWALAENLAKGDVAALMMPNRAEYLAAWLGLTRMGVVAALINTHLRGPALAHCLTTANAKCIIVDPALEHALEGVGAGVPIHHLDALLAARLARFAGQPPMPAPPRAVTLADPALLIYTSGTTGLPKAAFVSHHRVMMWTHWFAGMMEATAQDRLYNCLPMYHSVGGVVASGAVLVAGGSVVLREKFSAGAFWDDIARSGATIFQYIGELCRYLMRSPAQPCAHRLRLACGNGLSADVWEAFQARFAVPRILEFYAATEGNFSLYNAEGRPGAVGRVPGFLRHRFAVALIARGPDGAPLRGPDGFCRRVAPGAAGEAIGRIANGAARFEGYSDKAAGDAKILRDVFETGDAWLRTGDLLRQDEDGFYYFVDRLGDTFRWKGENVATTEVAAALSSYPGVVAAAVYGVHVPGADGRAGMAALETDAAFVLSGLRKHLSERLPAYARPLFLRLVPALAVTETFKRKKQALADEGCDPARIADPLFVDPGGGYVPLDASLYARISTGLVRF